MPVNRPKKNVTVVAYHGGRCMTVRLEYDHAHAKQSVFLNDRLMSSIQREPGTSGRHLFRAWDGESSATGILADYEILFAIDKQSPLIYYQIWRSNAGSADTDMRCLHANTELGKWDEQFPDGVQKVTCTECEQELVCPECAYNVFSRCGACGCELICRDCGEVICDKCDAALTCPKCNVPTCNCCEKDLTCLECNPLPLKCTYCASDLECPRGCGRTALTRSETQYDIGSMQERLTALDGDTLQSMLIQKVGHARDEREAWPELIEEILSEYESYSDADDVDDEEEQQDEEVDEDAPRDEE